VISFPREQKMLNYDSSSKSFLKINNISLNENYGSFDHKSDLQFEMDSFPRRSITNKLKNA